MRRNVEFVTEFCGIKDQRIGYILRFYSKRVTYVLIRILYNQCITTLSMFLLLTISIGSNRITSRSTTCERTEEHRLKVQPDLARVSASVAYGRLLWILREEWAETARASRREQAKR
jgi:hypothetical protein